MSVRLQFPRGGFFSFERQFVVGGAALNLSGGTLAAYLKTSPDDADADALAVLTIAAVDATQGTVLISLTAAQTASLPLGIAAYWVARATVSGATYAPEALHGPVVLTPLEYLAGAELDDTGVTETLVPDETGLTLIPQYQPLDSDLTAIAALSPTNGDVIQRVAGAWLNRALSALGLVKSDVGLGSVDNTSDAAKPVSTAQQAALDLKAPLASPTFTGIVTLPADPVSALGAATKQYVDNLAAGFDVKASIVAATTANITLSGAQTIDGIAVTTGDRVLVKNQTTPAQNGLYLVAAGAWTRTTDADTWAELPGAFCFVEKGTTQADTGWVCTVDAGGSLGTTAVTFSQFSGVGAYQPLNTNLTAEAALTGAADRVSYYTGLGAKALATFTAFGRTLLAYADAASCFAGIKQAATTGATGVVQLATSAEALAGTDTAKAIVPAALEARALQGTQSRQLNETLYFDGGLTTRGYWLPGSVGSAPNGPWTFAHLVHVPIAAAIGGLGMVSEGAENATTANYSLGWKFYADGKIYVQMINSSGSYRQVGTISSVVAAFAGQWIRLVIRWDGASAPTISINGSTQSTAETTGGGSPPAWTQAINCTRFTVGALNSSNTQAVQARATPPLFILGLLSDTEVLDLAQTGRLPSWCEIASGSAVATVTNDGTAAGNFVNTGGNAGAAFDVNSTVAGKIYFLLQASGNSWFANTPALSSEPIGKRFGFTIKARLRSGSAVPIIVGSDLVSVAVTSFTPTGTETTFTGTFTNTSGILRIGTPGSANGSSYEFDDFAMWPLGPIFKPVIQPILVIADAGTNKIAGVLTPGIMPITDKRNWIIQALTNTSGNQQLLGASLFADSTKHVIDDWCMNTAGTPTVTAGSASAGTQYKASAALTAARNLITLVTRILASANLWVNSGTTDNIQHTITGHQVD